MSTAASATVVPLSPVLVAPMRELLLSMADDEAVIGWTDSEWTGIAPLLEEDVAMSSLSQDELGHARALYELLAGLGQGAEVDGAEADAGRGGPDADAIAYDREPADYRHARLLDHGRGDWAMTIARRYLYESADAVRLDALTGGSWAPLADLVRTIAREERYHRMHIDAWLVRLARADGEPRDRLVAALTTLGPDAGTVFTPLPGEPALVDGGILGAPMAELEARWRAVIEPKLASLGLTVPPTVTDPTHGRTSHGQVFAELHATFTSVRRSDPGATW